MEFSGRAWKIGDNIDTDVIIPARYLNTWDPDKLAQHCFEDLDAKLISNINSGDIIVAGENFGCGSSREHAPIAIKAAGISCVIAKSFARIFYRNAVNIGLPILECPQAVDGIENGHNIEVNLTQGTIRNIDTNTFYDSVPFPVFMQNIIKAGGLIDYVIEKVKSNA